MFASVFMNTEVPAGKHRFKVVTETKRQNLFWQLSTDVKTVWGFTSDTPKAPVLDEVLPMLGVDYAMNLSSTNTAPAGRFDFGVSFAMPNGVKTLPVTKRSVDDLVGRRHDLEGREAVGLRRDVVPASGSPTRPAARQACGSRPPTPAAAP